MYVAKFIKFRNDGELLLKLSSKHKLPRKNEYLYAITVPDQYRSYKNWGDRWRIPTAAEWAELMDSENCTWTWTSRNDVSGYEIKSNKSGFTGNSIFLPAAWCMANSSLNNSFAQSDPSTAIGYYWSSSPDSRPGYTWELEFSSSNFCRYNNYTLRYRGYLVRPVR